MDTIGIVLNSIKVMMKKPAMFVYVAVMVSLFIGVDYFYKFSVIISASKYLQITSVVSLMQLFLQPKIFIEVILAIIVFILVMALILSIFFSGVFEKLQNALYGNRKVREGFGRALRKYYLKTFWTFARTGIVLVLSVVALMIAAVPAIIVSIAAYNTGGVYVLLATIIDVVSVLVLFLVFYFIKMYLMFWFPSMLNYKKSLKIARMVVNKNFWRLLYNFIATDVIIFFAATITVISLAESDQMAISVPMTILGAAIMIVTIVFFFSYIFTAFKFYVDRLREEYRPADEED